MVRSGSASFLMCYTSLMNVSAKKILSFGGIQYCCMRQVLVGDDDQELKLRPKSLEVLRFLVKRQNEVVSKEELLIAIWKNIYVTDDSLVQCIADIRRILNDKNYKLLQTIPRRGYKLNSDISVNSIKPIKNKALIEEGYQPPALSEYNVPVERPSIALVAFELIGSPQSKVIARGLSTDIHSNLARVSDLFVSAPLTKQQLQPYPLADIRRYLGVAYLLTGTVQCLAKRVRITVSLTDTLKNHTLWTERYDRKLEDLFRLQDDISYAVVCAVEHYIEQEERKKAFRTATEDLRAWELFHQAHWYVTQTNRESIDRAACLAKKAIQFDPGFSSAYAILSITYLCRTFLQVSASDARTCINKALKYAEQSLSYDEYNVLGYWSLGRALSMTMKYEQSAKAFEQMLLIKPNFSVGHNSKGVLMNLMLRDEEALSAADEALRLSPFDINRFSFLTAKAYALLLRGDYEKAVFCSVSAAEDPQAYHLTHATAAICLKLAGRISAAKQQINNACWLMPEFSVGNYAHSLPCLNEQAPQRKMIMDTLRDLGVPETTC